MKQTIVLVLGTLFVMMISTGCLSYAPYVKLPTQQHVTVTLPHSGENVILTTDITSDSCPTYKKEGAETIEFRNCSTKGGPYSWLHYVNSTLEYEIAGHFYSTSERYICKKAPCDFAPTEEDFIKNYMNPERWLESHISIVCFSNGTYVKYTSGYYVPGLGYEVLFNSSQDSGTVGFQAALEKYNKENNLSAPIPFSQDDINYLTQGEEHTGYTIFRYPYAITSQGTGNEKNPEIWLYFEVHKAKLTVEGGNFCSPLKPI